jgi:hypothetical protein
MNRRERLKRSSEHHNISSLSGDMWGEQSWLSEESGYIWYETG